MGILKILKVATDWHGQHVGGERGTHAATGQRGKHAAKPKSSKKLKGGK